MFLISFSYNILVSYYMESKKLLDYQNKMFDIIIYISWALYILIITGISVSAPEYLETFDTYVKVYVSLFLLWRFNFLRKNMPLTELDRKIGFSAGVFLFTTSALNQILIKYLSTIKEYISTIFFWVSCFYGWCFYE